MAGRRTGPGKSIRRRKHSEYVQRRRLGSLFLEEEPGAGIRALRIGGESNSQKGKAAGGVEARMSCELGSSFSLIPR